MIEATIATEEEERRNVNGAKEGDVKSGKPRFGPDSTPPRKSMTPAVRSKTPLRMASTRTMQNHQQAWQGSNILMY